MYVSLVACLLWYKMFPFLSVMLNVFKLFFQVLLLSALKPPVSRDILDSILKSDVDLHIFFDTLQERHNQRSLVRAGHVPQYTEIHTSLQSVSMTSCSFWACYIIF